LRLLPNGFVSMTNYSPPNYTAPGWVTYRIRSGHFSPQHPVNGSNGVLSPSESSIRRRGLRTIPAPCRKPMCFFRVPTVRPVSTYSASAYPETRLQAGAWLGDKRAHQRIVIRQSLPTMWNGKPIWFTVAGAVHAPETGQRQRSRITPRKGQRNRFGAEPREGGPRDNSDARCQRGCSPP
jgi:hypothetical protein